MAVPLRLILTAPRSPEGFIANIGVSTIFRRRAAAALPRPFLAMEVIKDSGGFCPELFKYACAQPLGKVVVDGTGGAKVLAGTLVPRGPRAQHIEDPLGDAPEIDSLWVSYQTLPWGN
jgi:hypothetical protein